MSAADESANQLSVRESRIVCLRFSWLFVAN